MEDKQLQIHGNAAQMQAIRHRDGPAMVLAGPGSGKTFVIVQRIRTLIEQYQIPPSEILTITFTRQAAIEMRQRFLKITEHRFPEAVFGTFHSVFYQILTRSHPEKQLTLIDEREKSKIAGMILKDLIPKDRSMVLSGDLVSQVLFALSRLKGNGGSAEEIAASLQEPELFPAFCREYERMLKELNRLDFDDIITECGRLFREEPEVLAQWRQRFRYFLIDEYQDINAGQFDVMKLLAAPANHLFVVGDDDQSIYGFRGSSPAYMLDFDKHYPGAERILLSINYRCRQAVIDAASRVIGENKQRFPKEIRAGRPEPGEVSLRTYTDKAGEQDAILSEIRARQGDTTMAVIVRTNAHVAALAERLASEGIPFDAPGFETKRHNPYRESEVQDILAYLRASGKKPERPDLYRILNRPLRYLSREALRQDPVRLEEMTAYYRDRPGMRKEAEKLIRNLKMIGGMRPALAIRYLRTQMGYDRHVRESGEYRDPEAALKNLEHLMEEAKAYERTEAFLHHIEEETERRDARKEDRKKADHGAGVRILTMHSSKGLEFDTVWIPEINEGTLPSKKIHTPEAVEEERRLFYVAMTRARSTLILSCLLGDSNYAYVPSRFLRGLDPGRS